MKKFKLYATESGWENKHASVMEHLGIPEGKTLRYAEKTTVQNSESEDFGKFIMPVLTTGQWKCNELFNSSELVEWQAHWNPPPE